MEFNCNIIVSEEIKHKLLNKSGIIWDLGDYYCEKQRCQHQSQTWASGVESSIWRNAPDV